MPRKPAWLAYAVEVKARIEKLPRRKTSVAQRENLILQSLFVARTKHDYPGYLGDWEHVLEQVNGDQRNGHAAGSARKRGDGSEGC